MAFFHLHYLSFATCLCEKIVPSRARLQAIYATIVPRFAIQCKSIWLTHNVHREYFANHNLRICTNSAQVFSHEILPLYNNLFANTVVAASFWHLCVISTSCRE